ncbi:MAG: polysaccharide deacetylase family protein [Vicinamibacterales bacterium]|nr:polysaccharide deacetylase family protein [Vicinamibacterales bacterium]
MTGVMRAGLRRLAVASGWPARRIRTRRLPGVLVLSYHAIKPAGPGAPSMVFAGLHVTAAQFEAHCRVLATLCHPISLTDWRAHRETGRPLPARPVLVTFDDGYRSVLTEALPVLERHAVPAAVFACTGPIAMEERFWYDAVAARDGEAAVEGLKAADHAAWQAAVDASRMPAHAGDPHAPLSVEEVQRLAAHPLIELGAHSVHHPILARASHDVQRAEIRESQAAVASWTGRPVTAFAYPNGREGVDFDVVTMRHLSEAGITDAFTTTPSLAAPDGDRLRIPRLVVVDGWTEDALVWRLLRLTVA